MATRSGVMKVALFVYTFLILISIIIIWTKFLGILGRFIVYSSFLTMIIFGSVLTTLFGPRKHLYKIEDWQKEENQYVVNGYDKSKWNILLDTHFHTKYSDGLLTCEEAVNWHIAMGFNACFITDHDTFENYNEIMRLQEKYKDQILVLPGIELAPKTCHICLLGIHEFDINKIKDPDSTQYIRNAVKETHRQGGVVTLNHFPWSIGGKVPRMDPKKHPTREEAVDLGIDFIEASNWDDDIDPIDKVSYEFCMKTPDIGAVVGTDTHIPDKNMLYAWTLVNSKEFTPESLMEALRTHKTDVIFKPNGVKYPTKHTINSKYKWIEPFAKLGDLFITYHTGGEITAVDKKGILVMVVYLMILFLLMELLYFLF